MAHRQKPDASITTRRPSARSIKWRAASGAPVPRNCNSKGALIRERTSGTITSLRGGSPKSEAPANSPDSGDEGTSPDAYHSPDLGAAARTPTSSAAMASFGIITVRPGRCASEVTQGSSEPPSPCTTTNSASRTACATTDESTGAARSNARPSGKKRSGPTRR